MNRIALVIALLALAGCSTTEETVTLPTFVGNKVIYIADEDGDDASSSGDEVYVGDTGSLTQTVTLALGGLALGHYGDQPGAVGTTGPFVFRVVRDAVDGCPSEYKTFPFAGGDVETFFNTHCVHAYASNPAGTRFIVMATFADTGTNLFAIDPADPETIHQINVGNAGFPGTVYDMVVSADGTTLFWADATGVATADLTATLTTINLTASLLAVGDQSTGLYALHNGFAVVYARDDEERFKMVFADGSGYTYLTNTLGVNDVIGREPQSVRISPDDTQMLYQVTFSGVKQLYRVPLAASLTEARADTAASSLRQTDDYSFEFSPDSASYAWSGNDGVNGSQVFVSTVGAPGTIVTLTPVTQEQVGALIWTDNSTIAYISSDADEAAPIGAEALRTVNTATPGTTLLMGPAETDGFFVGDVTTCSDGTLVFDLRFEDVDGAHTALFAADPIVAGSAVRFTPEIIAPSDEIFGFTCVD
jgi:hypothetical protein